MSRFIYCYDECHYAECQYAECHYAECHYAKCHYAECYYAESNNLNGILPSVVEPSIEFDLAVNSFKNRPPGVNVTKLYFHSAECHVAQCKIEHGCK